MEIYLANPQGFCSGVSLAVSVVEEVLKKYGTPLYVFHEIVHNTFVVEDFRKRGVIFVNDLEDVPDGQRLIFSAHGVPPATAQRAEEKKLIITDATCPLVRRIHNQALRNSIDDVETILIGHKKHQEMIGTSGYVKKELLHIVQSEQDIEPLKIDPTKRISFLTQTTLSVSDTAQLIKKLRERFPNEIVSSKGGICYATQNRQDAVLALTEFCDCIIVCGSKNSSNSNRLKEISEKKGVVSILVDQAQDLELFMIQGKEKIGISSGASVPCYIVDEVVARLKNNFTVSAVEIFGKGEKKISFALPKI